MKTLVCALAAFGLYATCAKADDYQAACSIPPSTLQHVQAQLTAAAAGGNGGIFKPNNLMWSAIVDRSGTLCSVVTTGGAWPGSRAIAIAKAETANDFSNAKLALSTANLYGPSLPGGSLFGLNNSNPFNSFYNAEVTGGGEGTGVGRNPGGIITFGGGVALYSNGQVIGGLGLSGDSSCADHAVAYKMRHLAGLDIIPGGVGPAGTDNIAYYAYGSNVATQDPSQFAQPHCLPSDITP
jgi:uncharacterized protein GlcG (DUF336 family)